MILDTEDSAEFYWSKGTDTLTRRSRFAVLPDAPFQQIKGCFRVFGGAMTCVRCAVLNEITKFLLHTKAISH